MDIADVTDRRTFDAESYQKHNLFETDRMFSDVYCFEPGQSQTPHTHDDADKVYYVLDGEGTFLVDGEEHSLGEGQAIIATAGEEHGVRNDSDERLRTLVFMTWGGTDD
jgi:quercetin dioxygenase-like cupin family protein